MKNLLDTKKKIGSQTCNQESKLRKSVMHHQTKQPERREFGHIVIKGLLSLETFCNEIGGCVAGGGGQNVRTRLQLPNLYTRSCLSSIFSVFEILPLFDMNIIFLLFPIVLLPARFSFSFLLSFSYFFHPFSSRKKLHYFSHTISRYFKTKSSNSKE